MRCINGKAGLILNFLGEDKLLKIDLAYLLFKIRFVQAAKHYGGCNCHFLSSHPPPFQVTHVEPWEKGSRKTAGQTGMCGGVSRSTCLLKFFCLVNKFCKCS